MRLRFLPPVLLLAMIPTISTAVTRDASVHIDATRSQPVSPELYGIFFEDINYGGEGGIYAELIRNRFFEENISPPRCTHPKPGIVCNERGWQSPFPTHDPIPGWRIVGERVTASHSDALRLNQARERSLRVHLTAGNDAAGLAALGYGGISVQKDKRYRLTVWAHGTATFTDMLSANLVAGGRILASVTLPPLQSQSWTRHDVELTATEDAPAAELQLTSTATGTFWLAGVSLFPVETWKGRPNGQRPDLMAMLAALNPKFLRFPGGCVAEGFSRETAIRWKDTIGPIEERRGHWSLWGYRDTGGLGYHEFLIMSEDLGADAMWVFNAGLSCQARAPEVVPLDQLQPLIQDALDGIEYAIGPVDSPWGARRAAAGHPAPFPLKYVGIGNENYGPDYDARYKLFYDAIKARYPQLETIASAAVSSAPVEILDEHYYPDPDYFVAHHDHYDSAPRDGRKIFIGEFATIVNCGKGNLRAAVGEAAFLLGLERNPDLVRMASYAPLFKNVLHPDPWNPDAIVFDTHRAFGTPSFHVLELFGRNRGDMLLATTVNSPQRLPAGRGTVGIGTSQSQAEFRHVRVTANDGAVHALHFAAFSDRRTPNWEAQSDGLRTTGIGDTLTLAGNRVWETFRLELEARIVSGGGGLRIRLLDNGRESADRDYIELTLGGSANDVFRLERFIGWTQESLATSRPGRIEPGSWHKLAIDVTGSEVVVRLDDTEILRGKRRPLPDIVSIATLDSATGDLIVKLVNTAAEPRTVAFSLAGIPARGIGSVETITAQTPEAENTFDSPRAVAPAAAPLSATGSAFQHKIPSHAVQVLRLKPAN
jgi:alpha-N-arabinofuranosidase